MLPARPRMHSFPVWLALAAATLAQTACMETRAYIQDGNADSVSVSYAGSPDAALPAARRHCVGYERMPVFVKADGEIAVYNCVPPQTRPLR